MPWRYSGFLSQGVNLSSSCIDAPGLGELPEGAMMSYHLEMNSPVAMVSAGIAAVPIIWAPKTSSSLT